MTIVIDAHQHFWAYGTYQTSWMEVSPYRGDPIFLPIRRSFTPADLLPELELATIQATVVVEAADADEENAALLAYARANSWIAGVVGWVPLDRPEEAARMLDAMSREQKFVGVRHLINVEPNPDWILRPEVIEGLRIVAERGLTFDYVAILPRHLEHIPRLAERVPGLRIVIDHLGKPPIAAGGFEPWGSLLARAAQAPNVFAKLSGLDAGIGDQWSAADIAPYIHHALEVFGPKRLMVGSDWPVAVLRGGYAKVWRESAAALAGLTQREREQILGGSAVEAYRLSITA